ncbi:MAG TPA: DUF4173 domain-containing protein [Pyrinomonadaceae bacterium]|nr:DUF4173 domain-containing protein [Pyrinomonadaceae bacterium]
MTERTRRGLDVLQAALILGAAGDALLRVTPWGLNLLLWVLMGIAAGIALLARWRRASLTSEGRLIILPLIFFAACFVWRDSPTLKLLDSIAIVLALSLAVLRTRAVSLRLASMKEHLVAFGFTIFDVVLGLPTVILGDVEWKEIQQARWSRHAAPIARGLLIAVPLILLFGGLLMAADAVFEGLINDAFNLNTEILFSHAGLTILFAWVAAGVLRGVLEGRDRVLANSSDAALLSLGVSAPVDEKQAEKSEAEQKAETPDAQPAYRKPSLSIVEIGVALGLLDLLFLAFVTVQIRYFFGGAALVQATTGLTYAEYARRGFFELVWVAALVLPLLLVAHWLLRKENPIHERIFRVLAVGQVALLFVIMASAMERVRLYQREYGLTEQRLYTMAFMLWLALVFLWFMWTVMRGARERFAMGALVAAFVITGLLHVANPDDLIVRANLSHAERQGRGFDALYAAGLSADAVPALAASLPAMTRDERCTTAYFLLYRWPVDARSDWRTWNIARSRAQETVRENVQSLRAVGCVQAESAAPPENVIARMKE